MDESFNPSEFGELMKSVTHDLSESNRKLKKLISMPENGNVLMEIGLVYYNMGANGVALDMFNRALQYIINENDREGEAECLYAIGIIFRENGQYEKGMEYERKSFKIAKELETTNRSINFYS